MRGAGAGGAAVPVRQVEPDGAHLQDVQAVGRVLAAEVRQVDLSVQNSKEISSIAIVCNNG